MCGLIGVLAFGPGSSAPDRSLLESMRDTMTHRGPDGCGTWISADRRLGLAHRRLAIIDRTAAADQPMTSADGRFTVVFNGEIYNHAELRTQLNGLRRRKWQTDHSDTEVLLESFAEWGISCLERFRGMFAFALWDSHEQELWLVRDRIGVKPMYYTITGGRLLFASEIKAILADSSVPRRLDEESLFYYLSFLVAPAPRTFFDGIHKLNAGTWLNVKADGTLRKHRYWDAWDDVEPLENLRTEDIADRVLEELRSSVALRQVSDVPVGIFLSGGIDSSTNAALFSEAGSMPVRTFSIGYAGEFESYRNELGFAAKMAAAVGADHHARTLTMDELLDFLPSMVRLQDEPLGDPVCIPVYYVAELAKAHGVTVCHVGEGADELFCGYPGWMKRIRVQGLGNRAGVERLGGPTLAALRLIGNPPSRGFEYLRRLARGQPIFWGGAEIYTDAQKSSLLSPRMRKQLKGLSSWTALEDSWSRYQDRAWEHAPLQWMTYADLTVRLPELLLMRVDKMTMATSVEARVPFLDHKFVALALSIPTAVKTAGGELKAILKRAVRGVIPDEVLSRPKQGFGVPVHEYFLDRLGVVARTELDRFCRDTDLLDRTAVHAVLDRGQGDRAWYLLNVALWWKEYVN